MPRRETPKLSDALAAYLRVKSPSWAKATTTNTRCHCERFIRETGDRQVHTLSQEVVEEWMAQEATRTSPVSYNKTRQRVRGFLRFCVRRGWLPDDLMEEVGTRRAVSRERMRLSPAELRELIDRTTNERDRALLATACGTGLRSGDLTKMRVRDVDLDQGVIRVVAQKTGLSDELPVTTEVDAALRRWMVEYARRLALKGEALTGDAFVFPATRPAKCYRTGELYLRPVPDQQLTKTAEIVHKALKRIDVDQVHQEGLHTIRRSVGRILFDRASESGHDNALRIAGSLLGHQSIATTQLYLGIDPDRRRRDELMRGMSLLGESDNVVTLRPAVDG